MKEYLRVVKQMLSRFFKAKVVQVALGQNRHADSLATLASSMIDEVPRLIKVELVSEPSINVGVGVSQVTTIEPCWMDSIINFLAEDYLSADEKEVEKVCRIAARYWLSADRKLAHRAMTQGFWWLRMQWYAVEYARKCEQCQRHAPMIHQLVGSLNPISSPWPFAQWGLDILGPFPWATGNRRFVLVAVDYFTKWDEAKALANIWDVDVKKFVWRNIVIRFGVSESLVSDNGLQFDNRAFREFCSNLGITNRNSTPTYL